MPRGANKKVWNEDLVRAFQVRWRDAHERKVRTAGWEEAVKAIEAVRKQIYEQNCKDGSTKIVNMPKGLKTDAANLLVNIVHGRARIVPPGMEQYDTYVGPGSAPAPVPVDVNDLSNHQYLKEMIYRKGGYAILMAFQKERQRRGVDFQGPLLKREIISLAQPFCDEEMEPRWQSRQTPAWRSINSLERHQFVKRVSNQWQRAQNDFQRGQMSHDEFSLTDKGVRFLNVMLKKFGEGDDYAGGAGGGRSAPSSASRGAGGWGSASGGRSGADRGRSSTGEGFGGRARGTSPFDMRQASQEDLEKLNADEEALDELINLGRVGSQKEFKKISKARRKHLHHLCDNVKPDQFGVQLKHESYNDGQDRRTLVVTVIGKGGKRAREDERDWPDAFAAGFSPPHKQQRSEDDDLEAALAASLRSSGSLDAAPSSVGHTLGSGVRDKWRALTPAELRTRAAEAASARAAARAKIGVVSSAVVSSNGSARGHRVGGAAQVGSRRLDEDFDGEEDADLKAALTLSMHETAPAKMQGETASCSGIRVPSVGARQSGEGGRGGGGAGAGAAAAAAGRFQSARQTGVAMRELEEGKIEIMDEDEDQEECKVYEIEESQPVYEIEESQEVDTVIEIKSQEFDDSADDAELQAALAASLKEDVATATSSSATSSSSRVRRQSLGKSPSLDTNNPQATDRSMPSSGHMQNMSRRTGCGSRGGHARILVDVTERKRNADPRDIWRRLSMEVDKGSEAAWAGGHGSGKLLLTRDDVEQKKLVIGDFMAVIVEKDEEDEDVEQERVLMVVERKTISDLCGRSLAGDHLRQVSRIRGSGVTGFLLLEGNAKNAAHMTVWGLTPDNDSGKASGNSVVQDEEQYKELLAWLVLTDKSLAGPGPGSVRVLQTKDLQHTLKLLWALSTCAACEAQGASLWRLPAALSWEDEAQAPPLLSDVHKIVAQVKKAGKELIKTLESRDVPSKAAAQIQERFGDMATVESMLDSCKSDYARSMVLDVADLSECRDAAARRAVLKVLAPAAAAGGHEDDDDDVVDLTAPPRPRPGSGLDRCCDRQCHIEASTGMMKLLLPSDADKTALASCPWLNIKEYSGAREVPTLWMTLRCCNKGAGAVHRESLPVRLSVVKGPAVVEAVLKAARAASISGSNSKFSWQFQAAAAAAAALLGRECDSHEHLETTPRILVLEAVERACSAEHKKHGAVARELRDLRLLCDMLVSCLLLSHSSLTVWCSDNQDDSQRYAFALARVASTQALLVS